ncbi:hypothetical protein GCM10027169_15460 [Gordonia jinhuaensis]|uniref:Uncharacterized protein n=1 Tax=Gordonia jinhuaensis TaxID=1517702 RepID=A0A916WW58_9ACTN|nr:hypothetical protein GCM10011489_23500 [Gordonia jinhuaensis]
MLLPSGAQIAPIATHRADPVDTGVVAPRGSGTYNAIRRSPEGIHAAVRATAYRHTSSRQLHVIPRVGVLRVHFDVVDQK